MAPEPPSADAGDFIQEPGGKYRMMVVIPHSSRYDIERAKDLLNTTPSSIVHQAVVWFCRHHPLLIMMRNEEDQKLGMDDALTMTQQMVADVRAGKSVGVERLTQLESMLTLASKREATS